MKFSITIPAYKRTYLKEAIDSCLSQTYMNFELIIINDASPEDLYSIVSTYDDNRIRYYQNEKNCGAVNVVDNWNKCLYYATGDYIICMGDDDKLLPCCLEEYVKLIEHYPGLGVYHAWTEIIDEHSKFVKMTAARCEYESVYSLIWHRWNGRSQFIGDFLFDTHLLKKLGGFYKLPLAWASDDITVFLAARPRGIANTQKICFNYRESNQTISSSSDAAIKMQAICMEMKWYKEFLEKKPDIIVDQKYRLCIINDYNYHFSQKKKNTIIADLKKSLPLRILFWIRQRHVYNLSWKTILSSFILSL